MGLDITAYSKIRRVDAVFDKHGTPIDPKTREQLDKVTQFYMNHDFPDRASDIEGGEPYSYKESFGFHAGSYGGYNWWRNDLARLAGYHGVQVDRYNTGDVQIRYDEGAWASEFGPFWELINFSDCEGVIGTEICAKLAKDFEKYQGKVDSYEDDRFRTKYAEWRKAFELAIDGAVSFH